MSDFGDLNCVKLSSIESGIKSKDEDEASAVEQKQLIAGCSHSAKLKTPKDALVAETAVVTSDTADGSVLIEDVLMLIFECDLLDAADLLHCRLVSRSWCGSATSVLLRSSACQISFNITGVSSPSTVKFDARKSVYCNNRNPFALLEDLNEIISQSPKFPCSSFRFVNKDSFGDAYNKIDTSSLHKFFSVHRNNVKTITVGEHILKSDLCSLLLNDTPFLECLDLQYLKSFGNPDPSVVDQPLFPQLTILPNLKTLVLGPCTDFSLTELVNAAVNLQSVETTRLDDLKFLLDNGKVRLIKKLEYGLYVSHLEELSVFEKLAETQPKLTTLIVTAVRRPFTEISEVLPESSLRMQRMQTFLNIILESSKDSLKYLEFRISPYADIKFPVLKNLKCLKLVQSSDQRGGRFTTSLSSIPGRISTVSRWSHKYVPPNKRGNPNFEFSNEVGAPINGLSPNRPCDSFPNLQELQLDIKNYDVERDGSLILLRTCQSHNRNIVPHVYKTVKVLEIYSTLPDTIARAKSLSNLVPNVTVLKVKCESVKELHCSLWVLCPLAKSIEIYGMRNDYPYYDKDDDDYGSSSDDEFSKIYDFDLVDSFFTGFTTERCKPLRYVNKQIPIGIKGNPLLMNFKRTKPSICDLKDLTDFKIIFTNLSSTFASHVTGFYAFRNMPRTKFTFAHAKSNECLNYERGECSMSKYLVCSKTMPVAKWKSIWLPFRPSFISPTAAYPNALAMREENGNKVLLQAN